MELPSMTSSKYPSTGMKSGIKSMGEIAYKRVMVPITFADSGVSLCFCLSKKS